MNHDAEKRKAARAAMRYVEPGMVVGVGTGSTVAHFIDALAEDIDDESDADELEDDDSTDEDDPEVPGSGANR